MFRCLKNCAPSYLTCFRFIIQFDPLTNQLQSFAQNRLATLLYPALEQRRTEIERFPSVARASGIPYLNISGYLKVFPNLNPD